MRKTLAAYILGASVLLAAPATAVAAPLYSWYDYQESAYRYMKKGDSASLSSLIQAYELIIRRQYGQRKAVPPGIYADYGWLLIKDGRMQEGRAMLEKEMELYPESAVLIQRMLRRYENSN